MPAPPAESQTQEEQLKQQQHEQQYAWDEAAGEARQVGAEVSQGDSGGKGARCLGAVFGDIIDQHERRSVSVAASSRVPDPSARPPEPSVPSKAHVAESREAMLATRSFGGHPLVPAGVHCDQPEARAWR